MDRSKVLATNQTGCLAKGAAYSSQIGQDLLRLANRARSEGKISEVEWQKLLRHGMSLTPEGMVNLILSQNVEK